MTISSEDKYNYEIIKCYYIFIFLVPSLPSFPEVGETFGGTYQTGGS